MFKPKYPMRMAVYHEDEVDALIYWFECRVTQLEDELETLKSEILELSERDD